MGDMSRIILVGRVDGVIVVRAADVRALQAQISDVVFGLEEQTRVAGCGEVLDGEEG